jgi:hypothetical protein
MLAGRVGRCAWRMVYSRSLARPTGCCCSLRAAQGDSVVPQQGVDPLYLAAIQATARVLRDACAQQGCRWDPGQDVRRLVASDHDGPQLLNALVAESVVVPSFSELLGPVHAAAGGHPQALSRFLAALPRYESVPAAELSQGLHESTLCLDLAAPWNPDGPAGEPRTDDQTRCRATIGPEPVSV